MRLKLGAIAFAAAFLGTAPAHAGAYSDELTKCLVASATADDQKSLMLWVFSALALHPDIKAYSNITSEQRDGFDKKTGQLFTRLITVDCRKQTIDAVKHEGEESIQSSFNVLGQVASKGLFSAPEVSQGMAGLIKHLDLNALAAVLMEGGVTPK
ncbi:hypothetical protein ABI_04900 [Asticcacaulis biprosthecium C19]|uniref:Uncharacterized protein n=1 Tax=Asticcacaulis biprosthecium C19 TaxID=715226 RepID=F4QK31_9CAUL|nr:hypothetical protein [Asticcacaulis biprosthecium]EGF92058.1 hypothetical protein ABI_04900 [Asticcacaulis biprosthecium C19]